VEGDGPTTAFMHSALLMGQFVHDASEHVSFTNTVPT
jgi:hypothetical protein